MESDYQASRLLWLRAGWLKNKGRRNTRETGLAKWFATVASERAAGDAVQIHGANGYSDEYPVGRFYRNCKGAVIYEGTREIHKLMQADYVLGYRTDRPTRCELPPMQPTSLPLTDDCVDRIAAVDVDRRSIAYMDSDLSLEFLRVVEQAAIACAHTMGQGDRTRSDQAAVEAMRREMDRVPIDGTHRHRRGRARRGADALHRRARRRRRRASGRAGRQLPQVDIAVDPLEGTNLCATGAPGAIAVLAASETRRAAPRARPLHGEARRRPEPRRTRSTSTRRSRTTCRRSRRSLDREVEDLVVMVLDRPRHEKLIADIRAAGARIRLIGDGDLSAGIAAAVVGTGVHAVMGIGGAPEGVLTAAAMRCLNGEIYARLVVRHARARGSAARRWASPTSRRVYRAEGPGPGTILDLRGDRASPTAR